MSNKKATPDELEFALIDLMVASNSYPQVFREFRKDGWPLCPRCGEDELFTNHIISNEERELIKTFDHFPMSCYKCGWRSIK